MSYKIDTTHKFEKSLKKCIKRGLDKNKIATAISILAEQGCLPSRYRPHKLSGRHTECWECHIELDWLLIWRQDDLQLTLLLLDTGTHSDLS